MPRMQKTPKFRLVGVGNVLSRRRYRRHGRNRVGGREADEFVDADEVVVFR